MTGWQFGPYQPNRDVRIGTTEREEAVRLLSDHLSAGRLELSEFEERVGAAYAARTAGQLAALFRDLPGPLPGMPGYRTLPGLLAMPGYRAFLPRVPRRVILLVLLAFLLITLAADVAFPPLFVIPIVIFVLHRRRRFAYAAGFRRNEGPGCRRD